MEKEPRLRFTDAERADPALAKSIRKVDKAAAKADKAAARIPKKKVKTKETVVDVNTGKKVSRLKFEEVDKKKPPSKLVHGGKAAPGRTLRNRVHTEIEKYEKDNMGVEAAHRSEKFVEGGVRLGQAVHRHQKLKPYRKAARAERRLEKANIKALYRKSLQDNPQSSFFSRWRQKKAIKRKYAADKRNRVARTVGEKARQAVAALIRRGSKAFLGAIPVVMLFLLLLNTISSCGMMVQGLSAGVGGSTYPSPDNELLSVEAAYCAKEAALQAEIDSMERNHSSYNEYRYDLDLIGHDPHELAALLSALQPGYTKESAQGELERIFSAQYQLNLRTEWEVRRREEQRTHTWTDEDGKVHTTTYTVEVPYNYYILNVELTSKSIGELQHLMTAEQREMYQVYRATSGNKPMVFGGGSIDTGDSEDLSGVEFINGTRPGNPAVVELAKSQVGNVGGYPYWSWYGFGSRVEWCACFVSWCYGQVGLSEPRFAGCSSQGVPWFQSRGQWGARDYENVAPGDAIFFDWNQDGRADHVGLVVGVDGSRVYTVEGNSGDVCKIKSYPLTYEGIKGYGLMNW